jgi:hypothetical protein
VPALEDFGLVCQCGGENFERVTVRRPGQSPYVTDFVACTGCKVMFWLPANTIMQDPEFKNDAADAARFYKKPSRR